VLSVVAGAVAWADAGGGGGGGLNTSVEITASNASYTMPTLSSGTVKFTLVGGGGGGAWNASTYGGNGGTTSIVSGGVTTSASGGLGGIASDSGRAGQHAFVSSNYGQEARSSNAEGFPGLGGEVKTVYYDLTDVSTINVTVGGGGGGGDGVGKSGFRGVIVMEYSA
jgi:hypothetical protein